MNVEKMRHQLERSQAPRLVDPEVMIRLCSQSVAETCRAWEELRPKIAELFARARHG
jgi:hypothetical protein